ncbi:lysylphosphatidylglycerol synthase transmembrane domain-containing protein [Mycoplasma sp. P36-A1]|uniref:lysylphosphatidylglycerol synthase transmembrane domain-containing protein n=1 Tax=Mycoplasma sp. P36-A1 TaxID=3252900 RepID=UPI003C2FA5FB
MDKKTKRNFAIIVAITFVVMVFSFKNDYENIIKMFSNINIFWFIIALVIMIMYNLLDAYFIYYYCRRFDKNYTFRNAIDAQQTGAFFSAITPFASGGQFAQVLLFTKQKVPSNRSASMLMLSFISWQSVLVIFGALALLFNYAKLSVTFDAIFNLVFLGFFINLVVIVGLFLTAFSEKFHRFIFGTIIPFLGKIKILKNVEEKKNSAKIWLQLFRDEFNTLLLHKDIMIHRVGIDTLKIFTFYSIPFFAAKALNLHLDPSQLMNIIILTAFVFMIASFIPLPGAAGGTEGTFMLLLGPVFGVATTSVMLLWRFLTYYLVMIVGFVIFANVKELKKGVED